MRVGIFVGGRGARMGYVAKGLLRGPHGTPVIEHLLTECESAFRGAAVLVGNATAYSALKLPTVPDSPSGIGPLGGLRALLQQAQRAGELAVVALACDMPFVSARLLSRISCERPDALAVAPRLDERWEPLCARYAVGALGAVEDAITSGERSLQRVFARLGDGAVALELDDHERAELRDWDEPADMKPEDAP